VYIRGSVKAYAQGAEADEAIRAALDAELKGIEKFSEPPAARGSKKTFLDTLTLLWAKLNWKMALLALACSRCR